MKNKIAVITISLLYLLYRVYIASSVVPFYDEFDSPEYFKWNLFPSFRTHGITLFFSLIKNEFYISIFQSVVGALVWIYLWISILKLIQSKLLMLIFTFVFFILGSSSVVIEHDSSILSESLALSSTIFLIGSVFNIYSNRNKINWKSYLIFGIAIIFFASTKSSNSIIIPLLLLLYILKLKSLESKKFQIFFGSFTVFFGVFFFLNALSSDITKTLTTSGTINNRLIFNEKWKDKLLDSGYPVKVFSIFQNYSEKNLGLPPDQAVVNQPEFKDWWKNGGDSFLLKFTIANPDYALIAPVALPLFSDELNFRKSLLSGWSQGTELTSEYAGFKGSKAIRTFFWPDEPEKAYLVLSISFFILGLAYLIFTYTVNNRYFYLFFYIILITVIWSYINWWFGSKPADMARHNLSAAVILRLIPIIAFTLSVEKVIEFKSRK